MRLLISALFVLMSCTACQDDTFRPIEELPFDTHPSVLRGNWTGTVLNIPSSQDVTLELLSVTAECADRPVDNIPEGRCYYYSFTGNLRLNGGGEVSLSGEGYAGDYIYVLTSPPEPAPPHFSASFELDGKAWSMFADYREREGEPMFEGYISPRDATPRGSAFLLEPAP